MLKFQHQIWVKYKWLHFGPLKISYQCVIKHSEHAFLVLINTTISKWLIFNNISLVLKDRSWRNDCTGISYQNIFYPTWSFNMTILPFLAPVLPLVTTSVGAILDGVWWSLFQALYFTNQFCFLGTFEAGWESNP